jgi:hypothetical protein
MHSFFRGLLWGSVWLLSLAGWPGKLIASDEPLVITAKPHHLRAAEPREWSSFPEQAEATHLALRFMSEANAAEQTLVLRQQDVKQNWHVRLNGKQLARLVNDENDMLLYLAVPAGALVDGANELGIEQDAKKLTPDDVRVGPIRLLACSRAEALSEATVEIEVLDAASREPLPARITVINQDGSLQSVAAESDDHLAVRPGTIFTADGRATFGLPRGRYRIYAGRGFEYSLARAEMSVARGEKARRTLEIAREVPTEGYVACDTHVHTLTHSGHGDATVQERMITLAAEGIELPIATDHNRHIDHEPFARQMHVRQYFTPVVGNEFTTSVGHFNLFPVAATQTPPDHRGRDWPSVFASIEQANPKVVILNHARDLHSGTRPFGPKLHNAAAGASLEGWALMANAMEVINSGAIQTDALQLARDWMTQLNHGRRLAPVGGSDSHDVARHFVGQGRTYIRADDRDAAAINIAEAAGNFAAGRVMVSYGLLAELTVDERYTAGDLAPVSRGDRLPATVRVLGPHWVQATRVQLFLNGELIGEESISADTKRVAPGVIWQKTWEIAKPKHDAHLVAIATGPAIDGLFWKCAKPYQPTSPDWNGKVLGVSGAIWLDADGDGQATPAVDYARRAVKQANGDLPRLLAQLADYDEAVAIQAAHLWQQPSKSLLDEDSQTALQAAAPQVRRGFERYLDAWRESQLARSQP